MEELEIIDLFRQAILLIMVIVSIIILPGLITGLIVSVFQAATQINEQSLSFIPRLLITFMTIMMMGPYLLTMVQEFTIHIFETLPFLVQ